MFVVFSLHNCLSQETKTISGHHYIKEGSEWYFNDIEHGSKFKVLSGNISLLFEENTDTSQINSLSRNFSVSEGTKKKSGFYKFQPLTTNIDSLLLLAEQLTALTFVKNVSLNNAINYLSTPNDALYGTQQWYANLMNLPQAWAIEDGSNSQIVVGVIDSRIDWDHEDLGFGPDNYSNIYYNTGDTWANPNDPNSGDGIDNDGNGYVDDYIGWDFGNNSNDTREDPLGSYNHGTWVAGILSAKRNNSIGVAGIAGGSGNGGVKILPLVNYNEVTGFPEQTELDEAIYYAVDNGCRIINMSLEASPTLELRNALDYAYANNVLVICASGNDGDTDLFIKYPAADATTIAVGGIDMSENRNPLSSFGTKLDISTSSFDNYGTGSNNGYQSSGGTSGAAPIISGIAALMLMVNPDLGPRQVKEIMTAKAIKSGSHNYYHDLNRPGKSLDLGYGLVDAEACLLEAQNFISQNSDLYMRDRYDDAGRNEGYTWTWDFDASPDIWIRNQDDYDFYDITTHVDELIEYWAPPNGAILEQHPATKYIYVRVGNKGSQPTNANASITVYFSAAGSSNNWPQGWDGTSIFGQPVGTQSIPILQPGESTVLKFPWFTQYSVNHCLLARINSGYLQDQIVSTTGDNDGIINWKNNNVALNNFIMVDHQWNYPLGPHNLYEEYVGTDVFFGNASITQQPIDLIFRTPRVVYGNTLLDEAELTVYWDDASWNAIQPQLNSVSGISDINPDLKSFKIKDTLVEFTNLLLPTVERSRLFFGINFLTDLVSDQKDFGYHIIQKETARHNEYGDLWTGGVHMKIQKPDRLLFNANAGNNQNINENEEITVTANDIGENAIYKWYDEDGVLIHEGKSFKISPSMSKTLNLEVVAEDDLFKDYDSIRIEVNNYYIKSVSPNPFSSTCSVQYKIPYGSNGILSFIPISGGNAVSSFVINDSGQTDLNTSSLQSGYYQLLLIENGVIRDAKTIQKQ